MSDLISKEEARDILDVFIGCLETNLTKERFDELNEALKVLSAERTAHWTIDTATNRIRCSECYACTLRDDDGIEVKTDYCSCCGCRMKEGDEHVD